MVVDGSALVAILTSEPEAHALVEAISAAGTRVVGAPTLVEASAAMLARHGRDGAIALDALLQRLDVEVVPMSADAARLARSAYARYGRGVGSPGVLDLGDCLSYGVARALGEPLLFTGDALARTDVLAVRY